MYIYIILYIYIIYIYIYCPNVYALLMRTKGERRRRQPGQRSGKQDFLFSSLDMRLLPGSNSYSVGIQYLPRLAIDGIVHPWWLLWLFFCFTANMSCGNLLTIWLAPPHNILYFNFNRICRRVLARARRARDPRPFREQSGVPAGCTPSHAGAYIAEHRE